MWLENILADDFVDVKYVQWKAKAVGMKKTELRRQKELLGAKTVQIDNGEEKIWLWYLPKRIYPKFVNGCNKR